MKNKKYELFLHSYNNKTLILFVFIFFVFVFIQNNLSFASQKINDNKRFPFIPLTKKDHLTLPNTAEWNRLNKKDQQFLDLVEKKAFDFFWEGFDPKTGLIKPFS